MGLYYGKKLVIMVCRSCDLDTAYEELERNGPVIYVVKHFKIEINAESKLTKF